MDRILSEFITRTSAQPGLARDLLEGHGWHLQSAINAYYVMKGLVSERDEYILGHEDGERKDEHHQEHHQEHHHSREAHFGKADVISDFTLNAKERCEGISVQVNGIRHVTKLTRFEYKPHIVTIKCSSEPSLSSPSSLSNCSNDSSTNSSPSKLALSKSDDSPVDATEDVCPKKLTRGISRATDNVNLVTKARNDFAQDFKTSSRGSRLFTAISFLETPDYTFTLPDLSIHPDDFRLFLEQDLIEKSTLISLESAGRLNWWAELGACQKMWPLATTGDGNCLLHAASLGIFGFHDRLLTLRKALHALLANSHYTTSFYRRWRWQTSLQNGEAGLVFSEEEWQREWECLLRMASSEPRVRANNSDNSASDEINGGQKSETNIEEPQPHVYESLEEIHIFALAHVLRRPIIVIADTMLKDVTGEAFFPIPFGGIYIPLECPASVSLMKSPLCLTYDSAHFSALVAMDREILIDKIPQPPAAIPLTDSEHNILPLQFVVDPGEDIDWTKSSSPEVRKRLTLSDKDKLNLLREYLDVTHITLAPSKNDLMIERDCAERSSRIGATMEKSRTLPSSFESDDSSSDVASASASSVGATNTNKSKAFSSKAARQFSMITKHFGSLGRMSKRIKKNLGTLARRGTSFRSKSGNLSPKKKSDDEKVDKTLSSDKNKQHNSSHDGVCNEKDSLLSAVLHTEKRHEYQDEMIRNYLNTARTRFLRQKKQKEQEKAKISESPESVSSASTASTISTNSISNGNSLITYCVNPGCKLYGTAATNYLCSNCFADQKQEMVKCQSPLSLSSPNETLEHNELLSDSKVYSYNLNEENDLKVSLSSSGIGKGKESSSSAKDDVVITCANSHFYVTTSSS